MHQRRLRSREGAQGLHNPPRPQTSRPASEFQHCPYHPPPPQCIWRFPLCGPGSCPSSRNLSDYMGSHKKVLHYMCRDFGYYWLRFIIYVLVSLCAGTIYLDMGTSYQALQGRTSCGAFIFGFLTFMSIGGFPSFVEDMKVFRKERLNGHYGVLPFALANSFSSMPFLLFISLVSSLICYFMAGLHRGFGNFMFFMLTLYASLMVVEGLMMVIASLVPNFLMGIIIGAAIQGIFLLVGGFFRLPNDLPKPVWRYPMSYLSFNYWSIQGQYKNDLLGLEFDNAIGVSPPRLTGEQALEQIFQVDLTTSKWVDLAVLFAMVVAYRLLFLCVIKKKENVWLRGKLAHCLVRMKTLKVEHMAT